MGVFGHPVGVCERLVHHILLGHVVENRAAESIFLAGNTVLES